MLSPDNEVGHRSMVARGDLINQQDYVDVDLGTITRIHLSQPVEGTLMMADTPQQYSLMP